MSRTSIYRVIAQMNEIKRLAGEMNEAANQRIAELREQLPPRKKAKIEQK